MNFRIFTLHPNLFQSYLETALIARAIQKNIISVDLVNWRDQFGKGKHKQVDDKPFGGGSGMVLMVEPIFEALCQYQAVSPLFKPPETDTIHTKIVPNNSSFYRLWLEQIHTKPIKKATIMLTPRGFPFNQQIAEWLTEFDELNLLSGRYEGFDARVSEMVDLEISLGNFILNGGEVAAMAILESVSRLIPGFVGKERCTSHDSFSSSLNYYKPEEEYFIGKRRLKKFVEQNLLMFEGQTRVKEQLFDDNLWLRDFAPQLEHPHYTRPEKWHNWVVPEILRQGNHKLIQNWRSNWWKND